MKVTQCSVFDSFFLVLHNRVLNCFFIADVNEARQSAGETHRHTLLSFIREETNRSFSYEKLIQAIGANIDESKHPRNMCAY